MSNAPAADPQVSRRFALKAIGATLGLGAFAVALAPMAEWAAEQNVEAPIFRVHPDSSVNQLGQTRNTHVTLTDFEEAQA